MKKKSFIKISFLLSLISIFCFKCSTKNKELSNIANETLLVSTEGKLMSFNLKENKIKWQYQSVNDTNGNRNLFFLDKQTLFLPFESGLLVALNLNSGKEIWKKQIFENGKDFGGSVSDMDNAPKAHMPLFMSQPMVEKENLYIASTQTIPALYSLNKNTGQELWATNLPTINNYYAPVMYKKNIFVTSAVYLLKYDNTGTSTSYGMFSGDNDIKGETEMNRPNQFQHLINVQMQADDNNLYIGEEGGKFYCLQLNINANIVHDDISNPTNTFIKNFKVFKWIFSDTVFNTITEAPTFLIDDLLILQLKNEAKKECCIFALNKNTGQLKWKNIIEGSISPIFLSGKVFVFYSDEYIFNIDLKGNIFQKIPLKTNFIPISNIEINDKTDFFFVTKKGIVKYNSNKKAFDLMLNHHFNVNEHDYLYIKLLEN